jgi:hypothetical protein
MHIFAKEDLWDIANQLLLYLLKEVDMENKLWLSMQCNTKIELEQQSMLRPLVVDMV